MPAYHGKGGVVYISTSGTGNAVNVTKLTKWTLEMDQDEVDTTAFGDENQTTVQGVKKLTGSLSGFWQDDEDTLFSASESTDGVKMYLYPNRNAPTKYWYGPAWLKIKSVETAVDQAVRLEAGFSANGTWARK